MNVFFNVRTDGSVVFDARTWARLGSYVQKKLIEDQSRGLGYWEAGAAFVHAASKAATLMVALDPGPALVPLSEPHNEERGKLYLSANEAAARRGCSPEMVRRLCRSGHIKARKLGREWLIDPDDLPEG